MWTEKLQVVDMTATTATLRDTHGHLILASHKSLRLRLAEDVSLWFVARARRRGRSKTDWHVCFSTELSLGDLCAVTIKPHAVERRYIAVVAGIFPGK